MRYFFNPHTIVYCKQKFIKIIINASCISTWRIAQSFVCVEIWCLTYFYLAVETLLQRVSTLGPLVESSSKGSGHFKNLGCKGQTLNIRHTSSAVLDCSHIFHLQPRSRMFGPDKLWPSAIDSSWSHRINSF